MKHSKLIQLLEHAIYAALQGGTEIMRIYTSEEIEVETKADNSPVTQADIAASNEIEAILKKTNIPIICEETSHTAFEERKKWDYVWIVDPLDGTKEFITRNNEFTVNIALIHNHEPILGVIYVPADDTLYFGLHKVGSYMLENTSISLSEIRYEHIIQKATPLPFFQKTREYNIVASRSHISKETEKYISEIQQKHPNAQTVNIGSSLKFCLIASGRAHIYPRFGPTCEWDTAAGDAIARAAGCTTYNAETHEALKYNTQEDFLNPFFIVERREITI
ncbi:MAG: 3'(2'),5'-bisphosphate nucleotidase CysQ [Bacteroidales bacterium]|jgi:3'(2'), 5'-bisphosphate nucleotidase|nr:3'(2'),5'-bisphosphate nucleotidase CysQ [Bacteroidales bacterium]